MKIAAGTVSWMSHFQSIVAPSTTETKIIFTVFMGQEMVTHNSLCKNARLRRAIGARWDAGDLLDGEVPGLFVFWNTVSIGVCGSMDSAWTGAPVARIVCFRSLLHVTQAQVHRPGARQRVVLSALVLKPLPAAPDPALAIRVTGYEPQRSGVLGDKQFAHFTIEEIPSITSRSSCSSEPGNLAKRIACHHLCPARTLPALVGLLPLLGACSDTVRPCHVLWTLVQSVPTPPTWSDGRKMSEFDVAAV
jgi:hypothetical protein